MTENHSTNRAGNGSAETLRAIIEASPLAMVALDRSGIVRLWNPGATALFGWSAEEALGNSLPIIPEGKESELQAHIATTMEGGQLLDVEVTRRRKDGRVINLRLWTMPIRENGVEITGGMAIYLDDSERKRAEEELRKAHAELERRAVEQGAEEERETLLRAIDSQRQLFQAVLDHTPAGIAILDGDTLRVKWANPSFRQALYEGTGGIDVTGLRPEDYLPRDAETGVVGVLRTVASSGRPYFSPEYEFSGFPGGPRYWRWSVLRLNAPENSHPDLMTVLTEITSEVLSRKKIEELAAQLEEKREVLELRNREVERANRMKSEFLANMSHELRTPLHSIIGFSELLSEDEAGELNKKQKRQLDHILKGARHLLSLINDILDLSKIEAGRLELHPESFVADGAISEVLTIVSPMAAAKKIAIRKETEPDLVIWADRLRFKQILYNLLSNAVKFTPDAGTVLISGALKGGSVEISVTDSGIGIPPEEQDAIFDEFHQANETTRGVKEGTGLGLTICRRLVENHGGQIGVTSKVGKGSCFTFTLPLLSEAVMREDDAVSPVPTAKAPRVLIVDDELEARELLVNYVESERFYAATANSGKEAIRKALEFHPDVITLDVLMGAEDGWMALHELKTNPRTAAIPVIIVSVLDEKQTGFALGAAEYLVKPVSKDTLLAALARHVARNQKGPTRVLVIDDEMDALQLVAEVLQSADYLPVAAGSGEEGLRILSQLRIDGIVLDLLMPGMDGFEVLRRIKHDPNLRDIPIFILTAKDLNKAERELLARQANVLYQKGAAWRKDLLVQIQKAVGPSKTKTILVADDSEESREFIRDVFASRDYRIEEACDGQDALRKIQDIEPDLVVMDMRMPRMDGYAVLRKIREDDRFSSLPVIALTAYAMKGEREAALAAGFNGYISKPADPNALRSQVEQLLKR